MDFVGSSPLRCGLSLEAARQMANHGSDRTTGQYVRVYLDEVERILI